MSIFKKNSSAPMLRTIIIDDEAHQRLTIEKMVIRYCPQVNLVAQANGVKTGVEAVRKHKPDLVLLDIKMDDGTGFDLLDRLQPVDFRVIFITAYDQYAIKAFRFSALDYLLKPLDPDELAQAVAKAEHVIQRDFLTQLENLREHLSAEGKTMKWIILKTFDNIHLIPVQEIMYCEADSNYIRVYLVNDMMIMITASLKDYEDLLVDSGFIRVHRSFLVNVKYIRRFEKAEGGFVVLDNDVKIPVASRKRDELLVMFERLTET
jgi:two-component system LytT family response regulator